MTTRQLLIRLLVCVAVVLTYRNCFYDRPLFDDDSRIRGNALVASLGTDPMRVASTAFSYRGLRDLTHVLEYQIFGHDLTGYHILSLLLHLISVVLVLGLGSRLFPTGPWAVFAALGFALHPLQTESVTYLSGRRDVLCGVLYLGATALYLSSRSESPGRVQGPPGGSLRRALAFVLFVAACFTKEHAVTWPAVILTWEFLLAHQRWSGALLAAGSDVLARLRAHPVFWSLVTLWPLAFTAYILTRHRYNITPNVLMPVMPTNVESLATYLLHYAVLVLTARPVSVDYGAVSLPGAAGWSPAALGGAMLALGLATLATLGWRRSGSAPLALGVSWAAFTMLPTANLFFRVNETVAEHYLYLPLAGVAWAAAAVGARLADRPGPKAALVSALAALLIAVYSVGTDGRNRMYHDRVTLMEAGLVAFPGNSRLWSNLGCVLLDEGRPREARIAFDAAHALVPKDPYYLFNRALARVRMVESAAQGTDTLEVAQRTRALDEALATLEILRALNPAHLQGSRLVARVLALAGRFAELESYATRAAREANHPFHVWYFKHHVGIARREQKRIPQAVAAFEEALAVTPGSEPLETLWQLALTLDRLAVESPAQATAARTRALALLDRALAVGGDSAVLLGCRGDIALAAGRAKEALGCFEAMERSDPQYAAEGALRQSRAWMALGDGPRARLAYARARTLGREDPALAHQLTAPLEAPTGAIPHR